MLERTARSEDRDRIEERDAAQLLQHLLGRDAYVAKVLRFARLDLPVDVGLRQKLAGRLPGTRVGAYPARMAASVPFKSFKDSAANRACLLVSVGGRASPVILSFPHEPPDGTPSRAGGQQGLSPGNPVIKGDSTVVRTLWGELAYQLGGKKAFGWIAKDDESATRPGGEGSSQSRSTPDAPSGDSGADRGRRGNRVATRNLSMGARAGTKDAAGRSGVVCHPSLRQRRTRSAREQEVAKR